MDLCIICFVLTHVFSASAGQTQTPTSAVLYSALSFYLSAATPFTVILAPSVSHIVIGRLSFRLLFVLLECLRLICIARFDYEQSLLMKACAETFNECVFSEFLYLFYYILSWS